MPSSRTVRKTILLVAKLGIAAALLWWLLSKGKLEPEKIAQAFRETPVWLAAAFGVYNVCILITAFRWRLLLRSQDIHPTRRECVMMAYIGCFFSCFLPGGTGGDLVKAYYVARDSHKKAEAATTVFVDRALGLYCMVGLAAVAILFRFGYLWHSGGSAGLFGLTRTQLLVVGVLGGFALVTAGLVVFLSSHCRRLVHWLLPKLPEKPSAVLKRIYEAVYLYRSQPRVLAKFAAYSLTNHTLAAFAMFLIGYAISDPVAHGGTRALNYLFLIPLGLVLNGMPVAPAGVGVFEWALGFLFATVLVAGEPNYGATIAALGHIVIILTNQIGLIFYLKGKRKVQEALHEADQELAHLADDAPDAPH
jgi:hypothetical protein